MGDWTKAVRGKPAACHYGCGKLADLVEPGWPWTAHKVCAEGDVGATGSRPLGTWIEEHGHVSDGTYGCGVAGDPILMGRTCGRSGSALTCRLCPNSPNYWRAS